MMRLSFSVIAGMAVSAAEEGRMPSIRVNRRLDGMVTKDLEQATKRFVQENLGKITTSKNPASGGRRTLRNHSAGKSGKVSDDDYYDDDYVYSGGKSGKTGDKPQEEVFHLLPSACPNQCISSHINEDDEMVDTVEVCQRDEPAQMWMVRSDGSYVMIESYDNPGMCISVDYEVGDNDEMVAETCQNGILMLRDCHSVYGTEWYFTGGQLINSFCWAAGLSSMMTVDIEDADEYKCEMDLTVYGGIDEAVLKRDTFMFVNRLPRAPFYISDVSEALHEYSEDSEDSKHSKDGMKKETAVDYIVEETPKAVVALEGET